ncbi:MAG TPA: outer membrane protein assembly factor BamB [Nevskiaceae bacterium]|nr:outer membrane protein assembly factor BamB [Nevskiaceae bacterium]
MIATRAALLALAALTLAGCSSKAKVREPAELTELQTVSVRPQVAWRRDAGHGEGDWVSALHPRLESDGLFVADRRGQVSAFDPASGALLWQVQTGARLISGPGVSGNAVLLGTLDGEVLALKRADGSRLWTARLSSEVLGTPVGDGDVVVARSVDGRVQGLSAVSGERLWTFDRSVPNLVLRGSSAPLIVGRSVLLGMDNGRVASLRLADGQPEWEQAIAVPSGRTELDRLTDIDASLIEGPGCVYVASVGNELACIDAGSGQTQWRREIRSHAGMTLAGDRLYVSDDAGVVWGLDATSGAAIWKQEGLGHRRLSAPAAFGGFVVVGDFEGYLHWLDPSDGRLVGRLRLGSDGLRSPPVAGPGALFVLNREGRLSAVRLP